jgi:hypothetical protein
MLGKKATRCWGRRPLVDEEGSKLIPRKTAIESEKQGKQMLRRK